jgi:diguanylate cyclase (GGDEF)-like protein/PAS domain S-box-containing protein
MLGALLNSLFMPASFAKVNNVASTSLSTTDDFGATKFNSLDDLKSNDGLFVSSSIKEDNIFSPSQFNKIYSEKSFNVKITSVDILSRRLKKTLVIENDTSIDLNYDDVGIRVDFSASPFLTKGQIEYYFSLAGETNLVYPPIKYQHIIFPSLPPGKTSFTVRAKSTKTGKTSAPVTLHFNVSYSLWRSSQVYIFYCVVVILLLVLWYRYYRVQRGVHQQIKYSEQRLQLALTGSNSEVWDWQSKDDVMFGKRIVRELGFNTQSLFYSLDEHIKLIHPEDQAKFLTLWQVFIANANLMEDFSCIYRLKTFDEQWLWYKDLGKIVAVDSLGKPNRVTGSYTNITESQASIERTQYYGDAFEQTLDWVLIINQTLSLVTANSSIRQIYGWNEEVFDLEFNILGIKEKRERFYKHLLLSLEIGQHWSGEELITTQNEEYHVMINISAAKNSVTNKKHYICVFSNISAQKSAENELRFLANYDYLTGLPNRLLLLDRIKHAIDYSKRKNTPIALFFIDLDHFKQVNDTLGHQHGDLLLKEISQRLTSALRVDDTVARIGGDEFVILLESFTSSLYLGHIAQKVIEVIGEPIKLKENMVSVSASIGIALYPDDAINSDKLLKNADLAMYHAKRLDRNNFQFFTDEMNVEAKERLRRVSKIKQAVTNNEFINHYQPIINAHTGKAVGFELLMRWESADEIIPPDKFIPLAEELGLITQMTESAIDRGLTALKQWSDVRDNLYLSVNLAPKYFTIDSLVPCIVKLLSNHQLPVESLRIGVTGSVFTLEPEKAIKTIRTLSKLGIKLALDDFGMGLSSITNLQQLPLDIIKIGHRFISGIGVKEADEAIVDITLVLAERLNMQSVAEGVETKEQLDYLISKNCHYIQGYFYSKPLPAEEVMRLLMIDETCLMVN